MNNSNIDEATIRLAADVIRRRLTDAVHGRGADATRLHLLTGNKTYIEETITESIIRAEKWTRLFGRLAAEKECPPAATEALRRLVAVAVGSGDDAVTVAAWLASLIDRSGARPVALNALRRFSEVARADMLLLLAAVGDGCSVGSAIIMEFASHGDDAITHLNSLRGVGEGEGSK